jgi:8-hydroxy-5-deazaflavin:NADPH oxidoreductase
MHIAIIGTGNLGGKLIGLAASSPHTLVVGVRDRDAVAATGLKYPLNAVELAHEAMDAADAIVLALPWNALDAVLARTGSLADKVLIDATNPLLPDLSGLSNAGELSAAERIQQKKPGARVVKAFNTLGSGYLGNARVSGSVADGFYCGDDEPAKSVAAELIASAGLDPCDVGPLKNARYLEAMAMLWIDMAVNQKQQGRFAFKLLRELPAAS